MKVLQWVVNRREKQGIKLDTSLDMQYTSTDGESKRLEDDNNDDGGDDYDEEQEEMGKSQTLTHPQMERGRVRKTKT